MDSTIGVQSELNASEDSRRHWCPQSEKFARGEVLLEYLRIGWIPDNLLNVEIFCFGGCRHVDIYYFRLRRGEDYVVMPVPATPAVWHVIGIHQLTLQLSETGHTETQPV